MFSGIVEESARVVQLGNSDPLRLVVESALDHSKTAIGDSICIDGVCLTVVKKEGRALSFDLAAETVRRTALGTLKTGDFVNLERSLAIGERLHGHFVFGHVDATTELLERRDDGACERYFWSLPAPLRPFVAEKGSISISGVSLTVGEVTDLGFAVYIIPHTAEVTTLARKKPGSRTNLEIDMLARYVHRMREVEGDATSDER